MNPSYPVDQTYWIQRINKWKHNSTSSKTAEKHIPLRLKLNSLIYFFFKAANTGSVSSLPWLPCKFIPVPRGLCAARNKQKENGTNDPQLQHFVSRSNWCPLPESLRLGIMGTSKGNYVVQKKNMYGPEWLVIITFLYWANILPLFSLPDFA